MNNMIRVLTAASWECENSNRDGREVHRHGEPADERAFVCEKHFWLHLLGKWMRSSNCVVGWGGQENRVADSDSDNARVSGRYRNKVKRPILTEVMSRYNIHDWRAEKHADGQTEKHDGYRQTYRWIHWHTYLLLADGWLEGGCPVAPHSLAAVLTHVETHTWTTCSTYADCDCKYNKKC